MSLKDLVPGGLYILLFIRDHPPTKDNFHWGLYLHSYELLWGPKFHIKSPGSGWMTDHGRTSGVFKSFLLVGLLQIATVPSGLESYVDQQIRAYDSSINTPGVTCRVWVLWVLALLQQPVNEQVILKCTDLSELEQEAKDWGNE